jgi:hypothetical protein
MYRPILNERGIQIGYADEATAYSLRGKMLYHLDRNGALMRLGDAKVVANLTEVGSALTITGGGEELFS